MLKIEQDKLDLFNKYVYDCSDEHTEYIDYLIRIYRSDFRKDCFTQALLDEYDNVVDAIEEREEDENFVLLYKFNEIVKKLREIYGEHDIEHYLTLFKNGV